MKKAKIAVMVLASFFLLFVSMPSGASAKVMWDGAELKKGQIGRLTVLKNTELYKWDGSKKTPYRTLKAGEKYRIYTFLPGKLGLGGGYYIDRDSKVKYETPSKIKVQALGVNFTKKYAGDFAYPQITSLVDNGAKDRINAIIKTHFEESYANAQDLEDEEEEHRWDYYYDHGYHVPEDEEWMYNYEYNVSYEIKYNENNLLSILIYDYMYTGGAHGMSIVTSYNFDLFKGVELQMFDVAKTSTARNKIKKYAVIDIKNRAARGEMFFAEDINDITLDNDRPFYFTSNGIAIKFYEYEVAPYAAGMPEVKVPYKIFR